MLGGMGSAIAYAGCNSFVGLPDRGPNAVDYGKAAIDNTTSYIPRFQAIHLALAPAALHGRSRSPSPAASITLSHAPSRSTRHSRAVLDPLVLTDRPFEYHPFLRKSRSRARRYGLSSASVSTSVPSTAYHSKLTGESSTVGES
jgi:hypothetical protein